MPLDFEGALARAYEAIEKRYPGSIRMGDEAPTVEWLATGTPSLDWLMGGGIPLGRWTRLYGGYMSCKSLTCWEALRAAQQMGIMAVYANAEKQYHDRFVASRGVDISKLLLIEGSQIEEIIAKNEILLTETAANEIPMIVVIDSLTSAVSQEELAADVEDWQRGLSAKVWGKGVRRWNERFDPRFHTIIMVDQVRDGMGQFAGAPKPPGGRAIEFASSMSLYYKRGKWLYRDKYGRLVPDAEKREDKNTLTDQKEPDGIETLVRNEKSRVSRPFRPATLHLDYSTMRFDTTEDLLKAAFYYDLVTSSGSWITLPEGYSKAKVQGEGQLYKLLKEDEDLRDLVHQRMRDDY